MKQDRLRGNVASTERKVEHSIRVYVCVYTCMYESSACTVCTPEQFRCDNGQCIASAKQCDNTEDCLDRSDERGCREYRLTKLMTNLYTHTVPRES